MNLSLTWWVTQIFPMYEKTIRSWKKSYKLSPSQRLCFWLVLLRYFLFLLIIFSLLTFEKTFRLQILECCHIVRCTLSRASLELSSALKGKARLDHLMHTCIVLPERPVAECNTASVCSRAFSLVQRSADRKRNESQVSGEGQGGRWAISSVTYDFFAPEWVSKKHRAGQPLATN